MSSDSAPDTSSIPLMQQDGASPLLLCVFIHGFTGSALGLFGFRVRLLFFLSLALAQVEFAFFCVVCCSVLLTLPLLLLSSAVAVLAFWLWLLTFAVEVAVGAGGGGGAGKVVLVVVGLLGIVLGGLLAYLGLNPGVFKNQAEQAISYVNTASDIAKSFGFFGAAAKKMSSPAASTDKLALTAPPSASATNQSAVAGWAKWAPAVAVAIVTAGAAGAAYYRREDIASSWKWGNDHMKYVGNLWDEKALHARLEALARIRDELGVRFRVYFTVLDSKPAGEPRTFCVLPKKGSREGSFWEPAHNKLAQDEVNAHVSMFDPKVNDGYYDLGLRTAHLVREAMLAASADVTVEQT
ncbi:hypothetical protein EXIGLDRAFT_717423 [Exidia glandulosa HHB12029]|uniref:Uncharacterized protein n=1 Tax=Exidia glandulosa HHB12029 TaxID=1314781 RepID=A0A166MQ99_EXIGL|nr:hypothetical protein EXIGLDRAFT_717423 [Exidia glandulosa HHB12029]